MNLSAVSTTQIIIAIAVAVLVVAGIAFGFGFLFVNAERKDYAPSLAAQSMPAR